MKKLLKIVGVLVLILIVALIVLMFSIGNIVEKAVPSVGSRVLGVPVSVEKVSVRVLAGKLKIKNLVVGNPDGFKTDHAFKLGELTVSLSMKSVFTDKIIIHKILIDKPEITYELGLKKSNLRALQEQIGGEEEAETVTQKPAPESEPTETAEAKSASKKIILTDLVIQNGKINLSAIGLGGTEIPIPLPTLEMKGIGEDTGGASVPEIIEAILAKILYAATGVIKGSGQLLGKGLKLTGALAADTAKLGIDGVEKTADLAVDTVGKSADLAVDTVGKSADLAVDTVKGTGKLVGDGAEAVGDGAEKAVKEVGKQADKLIGGLKGLLKKEQKEE